MIDLVILAGAFALLALAVHEVRLYRRHRAARAEVAVQTRLAELQAMPAPDELEQAPELNVKALRRRQRRRGRKRAHKRRTGTWG